MSGKWCAREHEHEHEHYDDVREGGGGHGQGARGAVRTQEKFEPVGSMGEADEMGVCLGFATRCESNASRCAVSRITARW